MSFLCSLWPWLAGALIGWLICGWFARRLKHTPPQKERIVEKTVEVIKRVDNPEHLSLISKLKDENASFAKQMSSSSNVKTKVVEKEVVKHVDNPEHVALIAKLKNENSQFSKRLASQERNQANVVKTEVVKDNPEHIKRISLLEDENRTLKKGPEIDLVAARAAGIKIKAVDDFAAIEGIGPKINELIHADGIHTFKELSEVKPSRIQTILDKAGSNYQMANPGTWPDQSQLAASNRWPALKALQDILDGGVYPDTSTTSSSDKKSSTSSNTSKQGFASQPVATKSTSSNADKDRAKAAGFRLKGKGEQDDFTVVEGIGPKINDLIHADGIHFYEELAATDVSRIQGILDKAGPSFRLAKPGTWPKQSDLAAKNEWEALRKWQDELDGGKE